MDNTQIIDQLENNKSLFYQLFYGVEEAAYLWKPKQDKWCLLQVICHLYDEEREDFRVRTKSTLETPDKELPMFDPVTWVTERRYMEQDYGKKVSAFLFERQASIEWLRSLEEPNWDSAFQHPTLGPLSAQHFLTNWLAHDYLHIRQVTKLKYGYLQAVSDNNLSYAGEWVL